MKDTSWEKSADWYDELLERGKDTYQEKVILPNIQRLLGLKGRELLLDLACGQGYFSREFAKKGAKVTGVDISPKLIELAMKSDRGQSGGKRPKFGRTPGVKGSPTPGVEENFGLEEPFEFTIEPRFIVSPAHKVPFVKNGSTDVVTLIMAVQNIENIKDVFAECSRVLKKGGRMLMVMSHPAFRVPQESDWGFDDQKKIQYRRVDQYLSESKVQIKMSPGLDPSAQTISFHRPLQVYFKFLNKTGFCISKLEEWISHKKSGIGPRQKAEDKARKEIPLFLFLEAVKY